MPVRFERPADFPGTDFPGADGKYPIHVSDHGLLRQRVLSNLQSTITQKE
jgi:hypothetical protein